MPLAIKENEYGLTDKQQENFVNKAIKSTKLYITMCDCILKNKIKLTDTQKKYFINAGIENYERLSYIHNLIEKNKITPDEEERRNFIEACKKNKKYSYLYNIINKDEMFNLINEALQKEDVQEVYQIIVEDKIKLTNDQKALWIDLAIFKKEIHKVVEFIKQDKITLPNQLPDKTVNRKGLSI